MYTTAWPLGHFKTSVFSWFFLSTPNLATSVPPLWPPPHYQHHLYFSHEEIEVQIG